MMEKREMLLAGGFSSYERTANAGTVEPAEVSPAEPVVYWGKLFDRNERQTLRHVLHRNAEGLGRGDFEVARIREAAVTDHLAPNDLHVAIGKAERNNITRLKLHGNRSVAHVLDIKCAHLHMPQY